MTRLDSFKNANGFFQVVAVAAEFKEKRFAFRLLKFWVSLIDGDHRIQFAIGLFFFGDKKRALAHHERDGVADPAGL